jgi:signal transduction histidine kinase
VTSLPPVVRSIARVLVAGLLAAVAAALIGRGLERSRIGATDQDALARIESELDSRFDIAARSLAARSTRMLAVSGTVRRVRDDSDVVNTLFQTLDAELGTDHDNSAGITIFDATASPLAWSGRVSDLPRERIDGPRAVFAAVDALGPRLVRVEPMADPDHPTGPRLATVVVEQLVDAKAGASSGLADTFLLPTSVVDVAISAPQGAAAAPSPYTFAIRSAEGQVLVEAEVSPSALVAIRARWNAWIRAAVLGVLAVALLLCGPSLLDWRRSRRTAGATAAAAVALVAILLSARAFVWLASVPFIGRSLTAPLALLPTGLLLVALVWLAFDLMERWRTASPRAALRPVETGTALRLAAGYLCAALAATALIWTYERVLQAISQQSSLDLLHFSLHPIEAVRLCVAAGLVLLHAGVIWAAAALFRLPAVAWRVPRTAWLRSVATASGAAGIVSVLWMANRAGDGIPAVPFLVAVGVAALAAMVLTRPRGMARRASQAARIGVFFLALLVPALAMYPSLTAFATAAKERLVSAEFAPQAARQREELQARLPRALSAIDAVSSLAEFVTSSSEDAAPTTDRAFLVWSQTEFAASRTTSAVELYGPNGGLVSWFALNLPEYGTTPYRGGRCDAWASPYEETSPFGSSRRNVLRVSRAICDNGKRVGAIVVRAMLDYRSLPFISSDNPYLESFRTDRRSASETAFGRDVEFAVYGWSRATIYSSSTSVWPLANTVFDRMVQSREPFWAPVARNGQLFRVYFFNDRNGIYALGYPVVSLLGHLINLGELVFLAAVIYLVLLAGATLLSTLTAYAPASGRALLREVRSSFYRKLFIAFVASSVIPVVVLAVATQRYFANQYRANVEDAAVKTATVAQRLVEDYAALQQRGASSLDLIDDQVMVLVRRAIDQDVNLFDRARLQATSERPLFASRLLPSRTPGNVYRSIVLDRLPTSVGIEEIGGLPYLLAAAPVRTGAREGIVTVPQPLRSREIEDESDELDRRVLSASVLFVLLGSAIGYWMAERIADPVNRLTRATRRIARGDLDARIATTSSDELRRLVEDFNRMADDLKRQRADLERTQRLEAWADMARQVAHDIKNPLTPIQLSAEHARRVNIDRGRPLSPVLDECVTSILSQVRLLRQISAEFSSFASSPTPRPERSDLGTLIDEVIEPYRTGLTGRADVDVQTAADVPAVMVDPTLFARALTNVIENALHAMPGGGTLTLETRWDPATGKPPVRVDIRDTGIGMDADAMARLFEPYFSTKATGTGLGLTIAKRNVELIGGTIDVQSTRGKGTTVSMRFYPAA